MRTVLYGRSLEVELHYVWNGALPQEYNLKTRHRYQLPRFILDPFMYLTALEEAEIIPGKDSDTRIKPLALTNGHGRYITVTPERALASVG